MGNSCNTPHVDDGERPDGVVAHTFTLNVYDLVPKNERYLRVGFGICHSGLEVSAANERRSREFSFGGAAGCGIDPKVTGVFWVPPRSAVPTFKVAIPLGTLYLAPSTFARLLEEAKVAWPAVSYDLLSRNCNHFTSWWVRCLNASVRDDNFNRPLARVPAWVNRAANTASSIVPRSVINSVLQKLSPEAAASTPNHTAAAAAAAAAAARSGMYGVPNAASAAGAGGAGGGYRMEDEDVAIPPIPPAERLGGMSIREIKVRNVCVFMYVMYICMCLHVLVPFCVSVYGCMCGRRM